MTQESAAVAEIFWAECAAGRLALPSCHNCGRLRWYLTTTSPHCLEFRFEWTRLSGEATLYSYTKVHRSFHPDFDDAVPDTTALVCPVEDPAIRLVTMVPDTADGELTIGMPMTLLFLRRGDRNLPAFKPVGAVVDSRMDQ